jgi:hypothetical protein
MFSHVIAWRETMNHETLVHQADVELLGDHYTIAVFIREDGRFIATTRFTDEDIIINDGDSLEEALGRHERLLPLAVSSRKMLRNYRHY